MILARSLSPQWSCLPSESRLASSNADFFSSQSLRCSLVKRPSVSLKKSRGGTLTVRAAVFDQLSTSLEKVWEKVRGAETLTTENMKEPLQDIRRALLEADVSLPVAKKLVASIAEKAVGTGVVRGVRPDQQLVKVVYNELVNLMGGQASSIEFAETPPTVILMAGLQGVGKTTACGKLALYLKKKGKSCMLLATDVYRPAAIEQLITLGKQVDVPVFEAGSGVDPVEIARRGLAEAKEKGIDVVIVDTAGRLQINTAMMDELKRMKEVLNPTEILLVVDAMTGQEAAALVSAFNLEVGITGSILTKLDGDSRGGAALSVQEVSSKPIKFVGEGERMTALELFYPDRMASRILGMGDVLSFVEKAEEAMKKEDAEELAKKLLEAKFNFNDYLKQMNAVTRMGSMSGLLKLMPGMNKVTPQQLREAERSLRIAEALINAMTPEEREDPELLTKSPERRQRVAADSGKTEDEVNQLIAQLYQMRAQMQNLASRLQGGGGLPDLNPDKGPKLPQGTARRKKNKPTRTAPKGFGSRN